MKTLSARFLLSFAVILISLTAQSALSQDCGSMVRDDAHLFGADIGTVTRAAEALQNDGAQVYVRTFPTTGDQATAVLLEHHLESQCPDWQAAGGTRKENLVAIIYADRDAAGKHSITVSTGGRIDLLVPPTEIDRIRAQVIIAELKRGQNAKAFADGLNAIRASYEGSRNATAAQTLPAQPQTIPFQETAPANFTGLWVALLIVLLGVVGWFFYSLRTQNERRRAARLRTQQVYNNVTAQINTIDANKNTLRSSYNILSPNLPAQERQKLEANLALIGATYDEACADFGTKRTSDLEKSGLSVEEYDILREPYQDILDKLNRAAALISETTSHLEDLQAQIEAAPKKVQEAQATLKVLLGGLQQVKSAGFKTETYEALAANAQNIVEQSSQALQNNLFFEALDRINQAKAVLDQVAAGPALPNKKAELDNQIIVLKNRIEHTRNSIVPCKPIIDRLDTTFAPESFESVAGNGSQATEHVNWCDRAVPMAVDFVTMEKQDWQKAVEIITEANGHLDHADSLVNSIVAMEKSLNAERDAAPTEIQDAENDVRAAQEYVSNHKNDLHTETGARLTGAKETIAHARAELQKLKPDYFEAAKFAKTAHGVADEVLSAARTEYEAAERLRQKADTALRDATSRVSKAREYIEDHGRYVNQEARDKLQEAEQYLTSMQKCRDSGDLEGVVKWADLTDDAGKVAYNKASVAVEPLNLFGAYTRANNYYAPSATTIFVNESSNNDYESVSAGSSDSSSSSSSSSSWFGGGSSGSDSSSSFSFGGGSDSSSSFSSGGGSDSGSSW